MKKYHYLLLGAYLITITGFFLSACSDVFYDPYFVNEGRQKENIYYVPSAPNTPLLTEKNDLNFNVMRASGPKFTGAEIQAAYLPWKHAGISASYSIGSNKGYMQYDRFEIGSGYVTKFAGGWHFETYAGLGNGKISNSHYTGSSRINFNHFFLQPAMMISNKKKTVQLGLVSRFEGVHFTVIDTSFNKFNNVRQPFSAGQVKSLYDHPFHVMWQPGFVFRFGWEKLLFRTGFSLTSDLTNPQVYGAKNNFSFGLSLRLNATKKKPTQR